MLSLHINWCFINYFTHKTWYLCFVWLLSKTKSYTGNNPENISKISSIIYHFLNGWNVSFYVIILNLNAYRIPHVFWACWKHHIKFHMFMTSLIMMHCKYLKYTLMIVKPKVCYIQGWWYHYFKSFLQNLLEEIEKLSNNLKFCFVSSGESRLCGA